MLTETTRELATSIAGLYFNVEMNNLQHVADSYFNVEILKQPILYGAINTKQRQTTRVREIQNKHNSTARGRTSSPPSVSSSYRQL